MWAQPAANSVGRGDEEEPDSFTKLYRSVISCVTHSLVSSQVPAIVDTTGGIKQDVDEQLLKTQRIGLRASTSENP